MLPNHILESAEIQAVRRNSFQTKLILTLQLLEGLLRLVVSRPSSERLGLKRFAEFEDGQNNGHHDEAYEGADEDDHSGLEEGG